MSGQPVVCEKKCDCLKEGHSTRLIVMTGGPGAGKTAILEMAKKVLCEHVTILPEAASIVFGGGFWRLPSLSARSAAQTAIFHVQREMERLVVGENKWAMGLCDRGTLDGIAYWPGSEHDFWQMNQSTLAGEYERYAAVIHLCSPTEKLGYNHQNPLRIETALEAGEIDKKIENVWAKHPNYYQIESAESFLAKAQQAIKILTDHVPECCRQSLKGVIDVAPH